jgi:chromosome segregation ATPase
LLLLLHIEKETFRNDLLSDLSLGYYRFRTKRVKLGESKGDSAGVAAVGDDGDTVDTIRKLALTWATRVRDLERDYKGSTKEVRRIKSELEREQKRGQQIDETNRIGDATIHKLEDRIQELQSQVMNMIGLDKYEALRHDLEANNEKLHVLEQHKDLLERDLHEAQRMLREAARTADSLHSTVDSLQRSNQDKHEELSEVKTYMVRTTKELQTLDTQVKDRESQLRQAQSSLDACERKNKTILTRLREVEVEVEEQRNVIHRLQSQCITMETTSQQQEQHKQSLMSELSDKDKELSKVQAMYKALAQAHRIATTHAAGNTFLTFEMSFSV